MMILETEHLILDYIAKTINQGLEIRFKAVGEEDYPILYLWPHGVSYMLTSDGSAVQDHICTYEIFKEFIKLLDQANWMFERAKHTTVIRAQVKEK